MNEIVFSTTPYFLDTSFLHVLIILQNDQFHNVYFSEQVTVTI